ncbi:hypothetical protein EVAR_45268_1 [Eumeta japonica]|uniref:Uncharacterized protein n=1 Tax=Eumeta variegata TaxID=151549 RepID=A0A4C1XCT4_EUMVA|nr:hypothetical protein EVAR_45268_1 [Eumeta japonica]
MNVLSEAQNDLQHNENYELRLQYDTALKGKTGSENSCRDASFIPPAARGLSCQYAPCELAASDARRAHAPRQGRRASDRRSTRMGYFQPLKYLGLHVRSLKKQLLPARPENFAP